MNLTNFRNQYIKIKENKHLTKRERNKQLSLLMTKMEKECAIPIIYQEEYVRNHQDVLELYQTISLSRRSTSTEIVRLWWRKKKKIG